MNITEDLLKDLEAKAKAATPGPWIRQGRAFVSQVMEQEDFIADCRYGEYEEDIRNPEYIAAVSPDVVLGLIEVIRIQRGMCEYLADAAHKFCMGYAIEADEGCSSCPIQPGQGYGNIDFCESPLEAARKAVEEQSDV